MTDGKIAALPGGVAIYAIAFANTGTITATNVKITETVPGNARFVLAQSLTGWSCADGSPAGSTCVMSIGTLAPGMRGSAVFAVAHTGALSPVVITNTARIGATQPDSNMSNNSASVGTPLIQVGGAAISPMVECVIDRGASVSPRYAAVFGYNNPNAFAKAIVAGNGNKFAPTPGDRGQPGVFLPGRVRNAFFAEFNAGTLAWTLDGSTVSAGANSPRCASALQIVSGVAWLDSNGDGLRGGKLAEPGLPLVYVNLVDASGATLDSRVTALDGSYSFIVDSPAGKMLQAIRPPLTTLKFSARDANASGVPGNDANDSSVDPATWRSVDLALLPNALRGTVNIGLKP